ncbi:MAG: isochorismatase family protein, partial [Kiloniellales bacterium]|nr:isochorismatase family protein [Kiloniellales bacterium]
MPDYTTPERARTALVTINLQRDFVKNGSPLRSRGVGAAMPGIQRLVEGFRAAGLPIVHAVRLYRPDGSNVDSFRRKAVEDGLR